MTGHPGQRAATLSETAARRGETAAMLCSSVERLARAEIVPRAEEVDASNAFLRRF